MSAEWKNFLATDIDRNGEISASELQRQLALGGLVFSSARWLLSSPWVSWVKSCDESVPSASPTWAQSLRQPCAVEV